MVAKWQEIVSFRPTMPAPPFLHWNVTGNVRPKGADDGAVLHKESVFPQKR